MTLHKAIEEILKNNSQPMTTQEIADELNEQDLYQKNDGTEITRYQVHGRTRKYQHIFNRDGATVSLV